MLLSTTEILRERIIVCYAESTSEVNEKSGLTSKCDVPHAFGRVIVEVLHQLWEPQHGFEHDGQETQHLHKHWGVQQHQGDHCTQQGEAEAEEEVVLKGTPLPEVLHVQVYK